MLLENFQENGTIDWLTSYGQGLDGDGFRTRRGLGDVLRELVGCGEGFCYSEHFPLSDT